MSSAAAAHWPLGSRNRSGAVVDLAITVAALAGTLAQVSHGGFGGFDSADPGLEWATASLAAASTVPLLAWREGPRTVLALSSLAAVLLAAVGSPVPVPLGPAVAIFLLSATRDGEDPWSRKDSTVVLASLAAYLAAAGLSKGGFPGSELLHTGLAWSVAWFAGERTRLRHEGLRSLEERALRAEREAEQDRRLAIAEERTRIARDLHDAAGHAINVIAMRAGIARLRKDPERSQLALEEIEELARKTVGEIEQMVVGLRDKGSGSVDDAAPPGLASLDTLIARQAGAGMTVRMTTAGQQRDLDPPVDQAAYRILQEALTNAAKHGRGPTSVELGFGPTALQMTVSNAISEPVPESNGGHGLIGMRERAGLLGGALEVERADGVFYVRAALPYGGLAA